MAKAHRRPAWIEVDRTVLERNALKMANVVAPSVLCAVVKADGYGHGAIESAKAFVKGGAHWLAVAVVEEGIELRRAGIDEPILLLSEPLGGGMEEAVVHKLVPTIYTHEGIVQLVQATKKLGSQGESTQFHIKVDTGMHRVGCAPGQLVDLVELASQFREITLSGLWTHFALADDLSSDFSRAQISQFDAVVDQALTGVNQTVVVHMANSAAAGRYEEARRDMVRCGISLYGYSPIDGPEEPTFESAMALKARVSFVKEVPENSGLSYGHQYVTEHQTTIATVPIGYADGVPRRYGSCGGHVLIGGKPCRVVGAVTMDQLLVDCGRVTKVQVGDEVVLLGSQGDEKITARDWAKWLSVITYEVVCGFTGRLPRIWVN